MDIKFEDLLFYDIEVFQYNSMVVFKNIEGNTVKVFSSDINGLGDYWEVIEKGYSNLESFIEGKVLVGYNNHYYDDYVLQAMVYVGNGSFDEEHIKTWNDKIIVERTQYGIKRVDNITLDVFQQIDVSRPSLKKVEGNMGVSIIESEVDFTIERPLTPKENLETLKYCEYDVEQTVKVFKMREDYFKSKFKVIEMMENDNLKKNAVRWNTTSIVGDLLCPAGGMSHKVFLPEDYLETYVGDKTELLEMWNQIYTVSITDNKFKKKKVVYSEFENAVEFGWGGLHGAPKGFLDVENVRLADVALTQWCN